MISAEKFISFADDRFDVLFADLFPYLSDVDIDDFFINIVIDSPNTVEYFSSTEDFTWF